MAVRCLSQYHNRLGPEYDGRIEVLREGKFSRIERCKVCGREYLIQYASSKEEIVKIELEEWQDKAIEEFHARIQT